MSTAAELLKVLIGDATTNGVPFYIGCSRVAFPRAEDRAGGHWGSHTLEVLGSGRSTDLTEDKADALWIQVHVASDSLASHVPSSVACNPPGNTGE
jgi:hypothetical protein